MGTGLSLCQSGPPGIGQSDHPGELLVVLRYQVELQSERVFRFLQQFLEVSHDVRKLELCSPPFGLLAADRGGYPRV